MFKNLSGDGLGVSCRQNELIELALTYGFKGIEVDIAEMVSRADRFGADFAKRFIESGKSSWKVEVGTFKLPVKMSISDADFTKAIERVKKYADMAGQLNAKVCYLELAPASTDTAYHDNFERHRERIGQVAEIMGEKGVKVGIGINATPAVRADKEFQFIYQVEPLMAFVKAIGNPNVGILLDTWQWLVGDGALDQITELSANDVAYIRLADVPDDVVTSTIKDNQRLLPGQSTSSIANAVIKHFNTVGFEGPVSVHPHSSQFSGVTRDNIVQQASQALNRIFIDAGVIAPGPEAVEVAAADNSDSDSDSSYEEENSGDKDE